MAGQRTDDERFVGPGEGGESRTVSLATFQRLQLLRAERAESAKREAARREWSEVDSEPRQELTARERIAVQREARRRAQ